MELCSIHNFDKYKVISVVGAGGKTTFIFTLARELGKTKRVLITTTTKIYVPQEGCFNQLKIGDPYSFIQDKNTPCGIYVFGGTVNEEKKLTAASEEELDILKNHFDYILIEADGSKHKPLKGWKESEPVIYSGTELTIGIIDIQTLGMEINNTIIHNADLFLDLTNALTGEKINYKYLTKVIIKEKGLFKDSIGRRMLFINKAECSKNINAAYELVRFIQTETAEGINIDSVIVGSLNKEIYENIF